MIDVKPITAATRNQPVVEDEPPSIPFYVAGMVVTLCGILSVTLTVDDQNFTSTTFLLTVIGFVFSVGCRMLGLRLRLAEIMVTAGFVFGLKMLASSGFDFRTIYTQQVVAYCFAWAMTAWSWTMISDGMVMFSALLAMATLGLMASDNLNGLVETCFVVFLIAGLFMLANYQSIVKRRQCRIEDQPEGLSMRLWFSQITLAAVTAVLIFLAGALLVVPAQMAFSKDSLAEAIQGLTTFAQNNPTNSVTAVRVDDEDEFATGSGDASWSNSTDTIALVVPDDKEQHYYKARTYDKYTGTTWKSSLQDESRDIGGHPTGEDRWTFNLRPNGLDPAKPHMGTMFDIRGSTHEFFYTGDPSSVTILQSARSPLEYGRDGHLQFEDGGEVHSIYVVQSELSPDITSPKVIATLRKCDTNYPARIRDTYIGDLQNDVTTAADVDYFHRTASSVIASLTPGDRNEIDEVLALTQFVSHSATYRLDVSPLPAASDHVRAFLETTKQGYCDMFASSLAVLCRAAGIPARIAVGFGPGHYDGTKYVLESRNKHAWVEVYFNGQGWVTFDPTMGASEDPATASGVANAAQKSSPISTVRQFFATHGPFSLILVALIVVIVGYVLKVEYIDPARVSRQQADAAVYTVGIGQQYDRLLNALSWLGLRRRKSVTPLEFASQVVPRLRDLEQSLSVDLMSANVASFMEYYTAVRYGGDAVKSSLAQRPAPSVNEFWKAALRARLRLALQSMKPGRRAVPKTT